MKIARVTVVDGKAYVEIDGLDVPVLVMEGQTLWLEMRASDQGGGQPLSVLRLVTREH